jgi:hypothetical protein
MDAPEQSIDLRLSFQQLKHAIWGDDQSESLAQGKVGDITVLHPRLARRYRCGLQLLETVREHGLGAIDAINKATRCRQREQYTAGTAAQFQHRGV